LPRPTHRAPIADDCQAVFLDGERKGIFFITRNRTADAGNSRSVDQRQIIAAFERRATVNRNLAALVQRKYPVAHIGDHNTGDGVDAANDAIAMEFVLHANGNVAHDMLAVDTHDVDGANISAIFTNRSSDCPQHTGTIFDLTANRQRVGDSLMIRYGHRALLSLWGITFARIIRHM